MKNYTGYQSDFKVKFQAAHRLPFESAGKCSRIHGHNFEVDITVRADALTPEGFTVNYHDIKKYFEKFDHRLILAMDDNISKMSWPVDWVVWVDRSPTTENLVELFAEGICELTHSRNSAVADCVVSMELRETENISASTSFGWSKGE